MKRSILKTLLACAATLSLASAPLHAAPAAAFQVEVSGQGQPVILIPGLASSGAVWNDSVRHLCGPRQCHVLTLAGFAGVPAIDAELLPAVERDLAAYIDANKLERPIVIGHSLGGYLALKLASAHPDKVGRLVIVDALPALGATQLPGMTAEQLQASAARMRDAMLRQDAASYDAGQRQAVATMASQAADVERILGWGRRSERATVAQAVYRLLAGDLRQDLARIKAPTLVLGSWIAYRDYAPRAAIEATFQAQYAGLAGVQIVVADTARHFIMYDDAVWMHARIDQFLR